MATRFFPQFCLLFTCMAQSSGSDTQVILWRADTLSSVAAGSASSDPVATQPSSAAADAQICVYDEHEDSVYSVVRLIPKIMAVMHLRWHSLCECDSLSGVEQERPVVLCIGFVRRPAGSEHSAPECEVQHTLIVAVAAVTTANQWQPVRSGATTRTVGTSAAAAGHGASGDYVLSSPLSYPFFVSNTVVFDVRRTQKNPQPHGC